MYAVVGCGECTHLWLVEGRPDTTECPRCGTRRPYERRKKFVETDDADHAREVRASMLANRQDAGEQFAAVDSFATLEDQVSSGVIDDEEFLAESGLDVEELAAADERATAGVNRTGSNRDVVETALERLERPTETEVVAYAGDRGVSAAYVERALEKLVRSGAVSESGGRYRLV